MVTGEFKMKVGDLVMYNDRFDLSRVSGKSEAKLVRGVIIEVRGRKFVKVRWSHGAIYDEHIADLTIICENR